MNEREEIQRLKQENEELCSKCRYGSESIRCIKYPPFTAEKQIELIKWLVTNREILTIHTKNKFLYYYEEVMYGSGYHKSFEESLAGIINKLWYNLSGTEKAEIRKILE